LSPQPEADIRFAQVSTGNPEPQEFLHSPAFDPPRVAKLAHKCLHYRKVLVEDRGSATDRRVLIRINPLVRDEHSVSFCAKHVETPGQT
jgi:hypothetical protein